jgi:Protein of unknown function (DUF707)
MPRNLVISPVGDRSMHRTWISGPEPARFDLLLIYFGDGPDSFKADAKYYFRRKGLKWPHIDFIAKEHADLVRKYDWIWCPDDDIACNTADVNLLFEIVQQYGLRLAQPAIAEGEFSFKSLVQCRGNILRYTPFVEVMCPVFSQTSFFQLQDTFLENHSAWGLDWLWAKRLKPGDMAVIDKVGVHHTGRLGKGENYQVLKRIGVDPHREFLETLNRHGGVDWSVHRRLVRGRIRMRRIIDPDDRRTLWQRSADYLHWRRLKRSTI